MHSKFEGVGVATTTTTMMMMVEMTVYKIMVVASHAL